MNGAIFGIPFWMIVAGGIGYLILKKKRAAAAITQPTPSMPSGEEIIPPAWSEEPHYYPPEMSM